MRSKVMNKVMNFIKEYCPNYNKEQLEVIQYGLEAIYITITKTTVIFIIAYFLGILKELIILLIFYNAIRTTGFGLHATKSSYCLVSSSITFICVTFMCKFITIPIHIKTILCILNILLIYKWAPADTEKRPIINKKRRAIYKIISTLTAITFSLVSLFIPNQFISNCLIFSLLIECFMISPYIYKLFKLPYDNYKNYLNCGLN